MNNERTCFNCKNSQTCIVKWEIADATAKIKYAGINKTELLVLETDAKIDLEPINENLNFENPKKFWNGFYNRQNSMNCKKTLANKVNNSGL